MRAVVAPMRAAGYGRIVAIASVAGKEGNPNAAAYSASKAGVIALTKSLGKELATTGVRVNCVTPAAVETPLFAQMTPEHIDYMKSKIPMNRFGTAETKIAALVVWLCTDECSFSTGAVFDLLSAAARPTELFYSRRRGAPAGRTRSSCAFPSAKRACGAGRETRRAAALRRAGAANMSSGPSAPTSAPGNLRANGGHDFVDASRAGPAG